MIRRLLPAFLIPPVATALTLAGVSWNRSAGREPMTLSKREFYMSPRSDDRSATRVALTWQYVSDRGSRLTADKLAAIGFDTERTERVLPRQAWIAFELAGPAFEALPNKGRDPLPRLVPIDLSRDPAELALRYPDASRVLITSGVVRIIRMQPKDEPPYVIGIVEDVYPRDLYVPPELLPDAATVPETISVRYGRRFEPWIVAVSR